MIQMQTMLGAADNSGAKASDRASRCWAVPSAAMPASATSSRCRIKDAIPRGKVKKGEVYDAVGGAHRARACVAPDGSLIRFDGNAAVLLNNKLRADRHAHLRAGDARAAHRALHEDRVAGAGSALKK